MAQFDNIKNLRPKSKFSLKVKGLLTGEEWVGDFEFWTVLTHRQQLERDRKARVYLGAPPEEVRDQNTKNRATALADLQVRIFKSPMWWQATNEGEDLVDDEVLVALYDAVLKEEGEYYSSQAKKAAAAKKDLQQMSAPEPTLPDAA